MQTMANSIKRCSSAVRLSAAAAGVLGALLTARWLTGLAVGTAVEAARGVPLSPDAVLVGLAAALGAAGVGWLALGAVLEGLARVPGAVGAGAAVLSAAVSPRVVRRAAGVLLGVGLGAGLGTGPALAGPARAATAAVAEGVGRAADPEDAVVAVGADARPRAAGGLDLPDPGWRPAPDPRWVPGPPVVRPQPDVTQVSAASRRPGFGSEHEVVVRRGDSLWAIAARHLGPRATDGEVAAEWPRWYAANRDVVGPDPDLLLPGQVLRSPDGGAAR
jgi:nucleoid-associated protein YgaU